MVGGSQLQYLFICDVLAENYEYKLIFCGGRGGGQTKQVVKRQSLTSFFVTIQTHSKLLIENANYRAEAKTLVIITQLDNKSERQEREDETITAVTTFTSPAECNLPTRQNVRLLDIELKKKGWQVGVQIRLGQYAGLMKSSLMSSILVSSSMITNNHQSNMQLVVECLIV